MKGSLNKLYAADQNDGGCSTDGDTDAYEMP